MPKGPKGPRALKFYHFAGFCKIYYSHFIFEAITFLSKIQNHSKKCQIMIVFQKLEGKTTKSVATVGRPKMKRDAGVKPLPWNIELKEWKEILLHTPKNCILTNFLHERSIIFFLVFSLNNMILNFALIRLYWVGPKVTIPGKVTPVNFSSHTYCISMVYLTWFYQVNIRPFPGSIVRRAWDLIFVCFFGRDYLFNWFWVPIWIVVFIVFFAFFRV